MFQKHPFRHLRQYQAAIWHLHVQSPPTPWLPCLNHLHRLLNRSHPQTTVPLSQQFNVCSMVRPVSATAKRILTYLTAAPNLYVPKAPIQTFPAPSDRHLPPSRTIVINSQAPPPKLYTPTYISTPKSATPTNHGAIGKPSPSHIRPSAGPSTKTLTLASRPSTSPTRVAMSVVASTPPSSSSEIMRLDNLQSSGGPPPLAGSKRRLGMGRGGTGYSNKKFKTPGL